MTPQIQISSHPRSITGPENDPLDASDQAVARLRAEAEGDASYLAGRLWAQARGSLGQLRRLERWWAYSRVYPSSYGQFALAHEVVSVLFFARPEDRLEMANELFSHGTGNDAVQSWILGAVDWWRAVKPQVEFSTR